MKAKCIVTFEYEIRPPDTWRGTVEGTSPSTIMNRAVRTATNKLRPRNWTSSVAVILERTGTVHEIS